MEVLTCRSGLCDAARRLWTGRFRALAGSEPVGFGMLAKGRFGWVLARDQSESVGALLQRLAGVGAERFAAVREAYRSSKGHESFATVLRQADLAPLPVLRRCLLLHDRAALTTLFAKQGLSLELREGRIEVDAELIFSIGEIMPDIDPKSVDPLATGPSPDWRDFDDSNRVLSPLAETPGYLASAVVSSDGRVLTAHVRAPELDVIVLGAVLASAAESAARLASFSAMGAANFFIVSGQSGTLVSRWAEAERRNIVALVVSEESQMGMAKYRLGAASPAIAGWAAQNSG